MNGPQPGVSREQRISSEGLQRLERQLAAGTGVSEQVLAQWVRRYGDAAQELIERHGRWNATIQALSEGPGSVLPSR